MYVILLFYGHFIVLWTFQLMKGLQKGLLSENFLVQRKGQEVLMIMKTAEGFARNPHARSGAYQGYPGKTREEWNSSDKDRKPS